ncbi:elongation factor G [Rhizobium sullae]|uniref:Ribosomal protection tetracycline resistance protein n=1 Tax=Rhizobium sullae TaxID=50338 RepID=A0A4R3PUG9_RHISU|nr:TetM/TetW/TetO/TetS family tetracycline resistance ribosomal protection protein [Rhizobium sullae]TCU11233.1 ribosomal protection tetracycline resistance protein [Rhizobium sullae]
MRTLNLGILAHVDAGKTSLTERLLFDTGVIDKLGSVDDGNTQTDTLELERQRGITVAAAVVSFTLGDLVVNLIDTPGHPDFIAEVERILQLLDAAVVVVSAVEGVQAQTRILVRALQRLGVPFVFFINKIDRLGARYSEILEEIASQLSVRPVAMSAVKDAGSRLAKVEAVDMRQEPHFSAFCEALAADDETFLNDYVLAPNSLSMERLRAAFAHQVAKGLLHPAFCGIAMTGVGIPDLITAIETLLPSRNPDSLGPVKGQIFKIERGWGGEKLAYLELTSGTVAARDYLDFPTGAAKVTSVQVFNEGRLEKVEKLSAGRIAKIGGLLNARIGDEVGTDGTASGGFHFAPPTLETRVLPRRPSDNAALWLALQQLSEQDPLINLRTNGDASEMYVSLYGEVQKEIIQATLQNDFGLNATFEESTVICAERLIDTGSGLEIIFKEPNPFLATIGLRVEPRPEGAGNSFALEVDVGQMPVSFYRAVEDTVFETLKAGTHGWPLIDCHVAMTAARHSSPSSTASDFRKLTPLVLAAALSSAHTVVCEPVDRFHLEVPATALTAILTLLAKCGASTKESLINDGVARLEGTITAAMVQTVQRQVPGLSSGAGVLENSFDHYAPMSGPTPSRSRSGANPFDRADYVQRMR